MCQHILYKSNTDPTWLSNLWTSDEANFNLNGINILELKLSYHILIRSGEHQECGLLQPKEWGQTRKLLC